MLFNGMVCFFQFFSVRISITIMGKLQDQLQWIIDSIAEFEDKSGRIVAEMFQELPSKRDYPDYYDFIETPVAIETIQAKIDNDEYKSIDQFKKDFNIMVENAMTYNRKGSAIYKDAQTLTQLLDVTIQNYATSQKIYDQCIDIVDRISATKNVNGNSITEYFNNVPSNPDYLIKIQNPILFSYIKQNVNARKYTDMLDFENDLNQVIENAKLYYTPDTQEYKDALQILNVFTECMMEQEVKLNETQPPSDSNVGIQLDTLIINNETYTVGDFVYITNPNELAKPTIGNIFNIFQTKDGQSQGVTVAWFLRPEQTTHKLNTKFLPQEVFKTTVLENYMSNEIAGKCMILHVNDFIRGNPQGFNPKDVYVCESRYNVHGKSTQKIKNWSLCLPKQARSKIIPLDLYTQPLILQRYSLEYVNVDSPKRKRDDDEEHGGKRRLGDSSKATSPPNGKSTDNVNAKFFLPKPNTTQILSKEQIEAFDRSKSGTVQWFTSPPLDIIERDPILHSLEYLYQKSIGKLRKSRNAKDVREAKSVNESVDVEMEVVKQKVSIKDQEKAILKTLTAFGDYLMEDSKELIQKIKF
ncbi:Bromodomain-containing protein [Globomyces pollinis-pini]|nr:Bromodomain-containing protein [Globomyces pollinis-pini]